jgi:hypothetical protein
MSVKMHELLAVNDDLKGQATKTRGDLISTFNNKSHLFRKKVVTFRPNTEGATPITEAQSDIQTTLSKEIDWVNQYIAKAMDAGYQIDIGNTHAKADLTVGDVTIKDVPATYLLQLEKHLVQVRELAVAIPTLDPAQGFNPDSASGKGIWKAREVVKERTKKEKKVLTLAQATDKHPAQVQVYDADVPTGTLLEQEWSALTTPALKSEVLSRCDTMIQAVKKARSRANAHEVDVTTAHVGKQLLDYVFAPLSSK